MNTKDVIVVYPRREEGQPRIVRLTHKPSNISAEGEGATLDEALAAAQAGLVFHLETAGVEG